MRVQLTTVELLCLSIFVVADDSRNKGSAQRAYNPSQYKNNDISMYETMSPVNKPIEYLKTPNFDVMLLSEDNSDPTWRKYSELFQPRDIQNTPQIEVNYGSKRSFQNPYIRLDRSDIESVLAVLGTKKHIIVLHPRNCKPHSKIRGAIEGSLVEFENEFLPKLLQQLHKPDIGSETVDPVVDRILAMLDRDEQKMLDDLRKTFEGYPPQLPDENSMYSSGYTMPKRKSYPVNTSYGGSRSRTQKKAEPKGHLKNVLFKDPCNEGYIFLVQNQKNPMNPSSLNDLLLRVLKVVTEAS